MKNNFMDPQHAIETGILVGTLLYRGVGVEPIRDNEGDYTPMLWVTLDLGGEVDRAVKVMVIAAEDAEPPGGYVDEYPNGPGRDDQS